MKKILLLLLMLMSVNLAQAMEVTPQPVIDYTVTEDAVIITAVGEGEVILYVNDEAVENPYFIARPEAGEEPIVIYVYATAQAEGMEMSMSDMERIEIEPKEDEDPNDSHLKGCWLVLRDRHGREHWVVLYFNGDFYNQIHLDYSDYGGFNPETDERPEVPFYFVIQGIRYGAPTPYQSTFLGNIFENPLYPNNNCYTLSVGYTYSILLAISPDYENRYICVTRLLPLGGDPTLYITGDVDGNAKVTIDDVTTMVDYLLTGYSTGLNMDNADINGNGKITIDDLTTLIDYLLKGTWW